MHNTPKSDKSVVADPTTFHPATAALNWMDLCASRGLITHIDHIGNSHHIIKVKDTPEARMKRVSARVAARAAEICITGPAPLIA